MKKIQLLVQEKQDTHEHCEGLSLLSPGTGDKTHVTQQAQSAVILVADHHWLLLLPTPPPHTPTAPSLRIRSFCFVYLQTHLLSAVVKIMLLF